MDGETNYESDISESWSLIDIVLNEESPSSVEIPKSEASSLPESQNANTKKIYEAELEDFLRKFKERNKTEFYWINDSDSDSSFSQKLGNSMRTATGRVDVSNNVNLDNEEKHDSDDAESIEILPMDGNSEEIDGFGVLNIDEIELGTPALDDEVSSEERSNSEIMGNTSSVIKRRRKRRKINRNSKDNVNSINSEITPPVSDNLKVLSNETKEEFHSLNEGASIANIHPVYKHCRNNVANTVLNLSVCVIFAGVACVAIGHFIGVQNAAETAMELMETLKKLQGENSALQSRLFHINEALLNREMNQNLELSLSRSLSKSGSTQHNLSNTKHTDLNNAALSEIQFDLNSIEWLSGLPSFVRKNSKETGIENGIDFKAFRKYIHDELCFLDGNKGKGTESLENTNRLKKLSKVLRKIVNLVSASKDNIEKFYQRLFKLKKKLNYILSTILLDTSAEIQEATSQFENSEPLAEVDLQKKNGILTKNQNSDQEYPKSVSLYKFPQSENYYKIENNLKRIKETQSELTKLFEILNKMDFEKAQIEKKNQKGYKQKSIIEKKKEKKNWKKKKFKEKNSERKKREKRKKLPNNVINKVARRLKKINNVNDAAIDSGDVKYNIGQSPLNETKSQRNIHSKLQSKNFTLKRRSKSKKNSKLKKVLLPKLKKGFHLRKKQLNRVCSMPQCYNLTGHWVFKWADGREEHRRYQLLSEWQFDRARGRKEVRDVEYNDNWQFERAKSRKVLRDDHYDENWQFKRALARESNRNDIHSRGGKYTKYAGKEFFHEKFSWI